MEKKNYIQPEIKWIVAEENLMAASLGGSTTDGSKGDVEVNPDPTDQEGGAKDNTWHTTSVWD